MAFNVYFNAIPAPTRASRRASPNRLPGPWFIFIFSDIDETLERAWETERERERDNARCIYIYRQSTWLYWILMNQLNFEHWGRSRINNNIKSDDKINTLKNWEITSFRWLESNFFCCTICFSFWNVKWLITRIRDHRIWCVPLK